VKNWLVISTKILKKVDSPIYITLFVILILFRLWLIAGIPNILNDYPHDDLFYAKAAHYIIHGQWMGPYNQMTLIKVPFYSFFLIGSFFTGLPLFLNENIFYVLACLLFSKAISPLVRNRWLRLLFFTIICYCPSSLATDANLYVYREFVYFSLTLYVVAFSIGLFLRLNHKISTLFLWSVGLGLSMGAFMITREEGVWIYPILFLLLGICLFFIYRRKIDQRIKRSILVFLPIFLWYIPVFIVSYVNYSYYGFWGTSEQLDADINRVYNTLARIKTSSPWHPAIQVTREARMKAYAVSPLLDQLKDPIESSVMEWNVWDDATMQEKPEWYLNQYGNGGSEIGSSHFMWLFRDAVAGQGYYANGKFPREFYRQLADQLEAACNDGKLVCSPPKNIPLVGSIDRRQYSIILRMLFDDIFHLLEQDYAISTGIDPLKVNLWPAWQNTDNYKYFEEFVYNSLNEPGISSDQDDQYLVNGKTDSRVKILPYKSEMMFKISNIYKFFTLPVFIICFAAWILLMIFSISKKRRMAQEASFITSVFVLGLLFSRVMTLAIVDATTSMPAIQGYGMSNYIFIYVFIFLMTHWIVKQLKMKLLPIKNTQLN
jgi:hypothetical protein